MKYKVIMNGDRNLCYGTFDTRKLADEYVMTQRCKTRGGGVGAKPAEESRKAHAAKQNWSVIEVDE